MTLYEPILMIGYYPSIKRNEGTMHKSELCAVLHLRFAGILKPVEKMDVRLDQLLITLTKMDKKLTPLVDMKTQTPHHVHERLRQMG